MVEVNADILRGPGIAVYLTGEEVECEISFKNLSDTASNNKKEQKTQVLAWACAQISCHSYINDSKVILPKSRAQYQKEMENIEKGGTSFMPNKGENGIIIYSSKPKILFCDLKLEPNVAKSFIYREKIPFELPPSYRGQLVKYLYKITIGAQLLNCTTQSLRVPFRVIAIDDFSTHLVKFKQDNEAHIEKPVESEDPENPFLLVEKNKADNLEYIMEVVQDLTARKLTETMSITINEEKVAKMTLLRKNYKIGDDIIGFLDFSECDVACVEYMVSLQSEEIISNDCKKKPNQGSYTETHSFQKEFVLFVRNTSFNLQVPVVATPTFATDMVSLKWTLHFDFMISKTKLPKIEEPTDPSQDSVWQPPSTLSAEKLTCTYDIQVYPTSPLLLSNVCAQTEVNQLIL